EATIYISGGVYFSLAAMMLMFSWDALTKRRRVALLYFVVITITGVTIQLLNVVIKTELFSEALSLLGVMISIESEEDRIDAGTGVYNRMALENDLNAYLVNKRVMQLICVKITNTDVIERSSNGENGETMQTIVAEFLKKFLPRYCIYLASPSAFMLTLFDYTEEETDELTDKISSRFEAPWHFRDSIVLLNAVVMSAEIPLRIASSSDALYMADSPVPSNIEKTVLKGSDLDYLLRRASVEKAIARGIAEHTFEVYYQPTYHLDGTLHGAEALLRLHDSIIGHVYPSEFIPVAEHIGMIDELDDFVLKEVCKFLKTGRPTSCGVENINVNLSVLQCMRPGFVERIIDIANDIGVDKRLINFEITESVAAGDYRLLSKTVNALKREGFLFSMDDYGTGYSNIQSVFSLNFDIVKIDKSILWSAEKSELGRIILENTVRMIKQMGLKILVEGVETQAQLDLLKSIGVDYLQGYFFSRPIPKDSFMRLIGCYDDGETLNSEQ
ncbi:MAG: EAL domain-containing protein, partial [Ruminococcus sp.]|nr:EAL domain-containing protein [Ruminococcus sp.]